MKTTSLTGKVLNNLKWSTSAMFFNRVGALIFSIIIARVLMPEGFGIYNLALSIALVVATFTDLGINETLFRYLSSSIGKRNYAQAKAYFIYILKMKLILSALTSLVLILLAYPLAIFVFHKPALFWPIFVAGFYIFVMSFEGFFRAFFYIANKVNYFTIKEIILQTARIFAALIVFFALSAAYFIVGIFVGITLTSIVIIGYYLFY